jgi:hypothetical protein
MKRRKSRIKSLSPLLFTISPFFVTILTGIFMAIFNIPYGDSGSISWGAFNLLRGFIIGMVFMPIILISGFILTAIIKKFLKKSTMDQTQTIGFGIPAIAVCIFTVIQIVHPP